jgi:hypothetical protein
MSYEPEVHYLKVENYFSDEELELIWRELDHLNRPGVFLLPEETGASIDIETGMVRKQNAGVFISEIYKKPKYSAVYGILGKLFQGYTYRFATEHYSNRGVLQTEASDHLISYYENQDHYKPHRDNAVSTALHWLWKEPKKFEGGELTFTETGETIPLTNNTMIIFPSYVEHEVSPVVMAPEDCGKGFGRYCLSTFLFTSLNIDDR